jgi:hypothetical protein
MQLWSSELESRTEERKTLDQSNIGQECIDNSGFDSLLARGKDFIGMPRLWPEWRDNGS